MWVNYRITTKTIKRKVYQKYEMLKDLQKIFTFFINIHFLIQCLAFPTYNLPTFFVSQVIIIMPTTKFSFPKNQNLKTSSKYQKFSKSSKKIFQPNPKFIKNLTSFSNNNLNPSPYSSKNTLTPTFIEK